MKDYEKWELVQRHRRAVLSGQALPIRCPDCTAELIVALYEDQPILRCLACDVYFHIGLRVYDQMKEALRNDVRY